MTYAPMSYDTETVDAKSFAGAESAIHIVGDTRLKIGGQSDLTMGMARRACYVLSGTKQSLVDR